MKTVLEISFDSLLLATVVGCTTSTQKVSASHKPSALKLVRPPRQE